MRGGYALIFKNNQYTLKELFILSQLGVKDYLSSLTLTERSLQHDLVIGF